MHCTETNLLQPINPKLRGIKPDSDEGVSVEQIHFDLYIIESNVGPSTEDAMKIATKERYNAVVISLKGNVLGGPDAELFKKELKKT